MSNIYKGYTRLLTTYNNDLTFIYFIAFKFYVRYLQLNLTK